MAWLRVDDGFDSHPKILALGSDQRRWTWTRILVYTCRYRSPIIPTNVTELVPRATPAFLRECVDIGLIDVTDEGTYEVHDWDDYQAGDPKKAARQRRWRNNVDGDVDAPVDGHVDASVDASRVGARARPVPSPSQRASTAPTALHNAAAAEALERLRAAGWSNGQLERDDLDRAVAWLDHYQADPTAKKPAALAWSKYSSSDAWPEKPRTEIAAGAVGTRSTSPPLPDRPREPEPEPAPPPDSFRKLAGRTSSAEPPAPPAQRDATENA